MPRMKNNMLCTSTTVSVFAAIAIAVAMTMMAGCAVDAEQPTESSSQDTASDSANGDEATESTSDALISGGGSSNGGLGGKWCRCKWQCDRDYPDAPNAKKACKKACDDNKKCSSGIGGVGGGVIMQ